MFIPTRGVPGSSNSEHLNFVAEGESDTTVTVLRRILQDNDTIAEFIQATTSHLRRFRDFEGTTVTGILVTFWNWARVFQQDPLCAEFLRVIRTSAPLWSAIFEVLSRPNGQQSDEPFSSTQHGYISTLAVQLVHDRSSSSESMALTELWVSAGVFDALEASIGEVLLHGTEDEQITFCSTSSRNGLCHETLNQILLYIQPTSQAFIMASVMGQWRIHRFYPRCVSNCLALERLADYGKFPKSSQVLGSRKLRRAMLLE